MVEDATIFDPPVSEVPIVVSAFGSTAVEVAARIGDGLWITGVDDAVVKEYNDAGGSGPVYTSGAFDSALSLAGIPTNCAS